MKLCKDCKTPNGCREDKECWIESQKEIECNTCGNIMSLLENKTNYVCYNSECTSCYEDEIETVMNNNNEYEDI
jgi:hypothetical protein